jgi:hypothetical protein
MISMGTRSMWGALSGHVRRVEESYIPITLGPGAGASFCIPQTRMYICIYIWKRDHIGVQHCLKITLYPPIPVALVT